MPLSVFRAALYYWGWRRWVGVTLLAYAGMLHPAEFIDLERKDLMMPKDTCYTTRDLYIHLKHPKTARFARQQHVKISDPEIRSQWNCIMNKLGIPYR